MDRAIPTRSVWLVDIGDLAHREQARRARSAISPHDVHQSAPCDGPPASASTPDDDVLSVVSPLLRPRKEPS